MLGALPDGRGQHILVRDWKTSYDFVLATGTTTQIRIGPTFPSPVRIAQSGSTPTSCRINGTLIPTAYLTGTTSGMWVLAQPMLAYSHNVGTSSVLGLNSARVTNVSYRLIYTGAASTVSGLVLVDTLPEKIDFTNSTNPGPIFYVDTTNTAQTQAINTVPYMQVDVLTANQSSGIAPKDQYVGRPENGVHGIIKSAVRANNHEFRSFYDSGIIPIVAGAIGANSSNVVAQNTFGNGNITAAAIQPLNLWDDQLETTQLTITDGGAFRLEVMFCLEMQVPPSSPLIDLTISSPKPNDAILALDDAISGGKAVVKPFNQPLAALPFYGRPKPQKQPKQPSNPRTQPAKPKARKRRARKNK
jgi:hypothetical protein